MRAIYTILILGILFLMSACSAKKLYVNGDYDAAIHRAVTKLRKKPSHMKSIVALEDAFAAAQNRDLGKIKFLKKDGAPENWDQIFDLYNVIDRRQDKVKSLAQIPSGIRFTDVKSEMASSKQKAASYFYARGEKLLSTGRREDARRAHDHFLKTKKFYQSFKNTDEKINEARFKGTSFVLLTMKNKSGMIIPAQFNQEILKISLTDLNDGWTVFHSTEKSDIPYHYHARFDIMGLAISPERLKESSFEETKEIEDGTRYVLDDNGNVMKDSLGNDIKVKNYKTITCKIIQVQQSKTARITGGLSIYNLGNKQLIKNAPITSDAIFEHASAKVVGDKRAMSKKSKNLVRSRPVPFPSDPDLIMMGSDRLKGMLKDILYQHRGLFY